MWDREYRRQKPGPVVQAPSPKKLEFELPDAKKAIAGLDSALGQKPKKEKEFLGNASQKIPPGPVRSWTTEQVKARLLWLQENEPLTLLKFIISRCGCFLEGEDE